MKLSYFLFVLSLFFAGCCKKTGADAMSENTSKVDLLFETPAEPYVVVFIKRTPCFGKCPAYEARIFSDGKVKYTGHSNIERKGNWESRIELSELNKLVQKAFDIKYFLLEDQYPDPSVRITDVPTTFTSVTCKGQNKAISNKFEGPQKLIEFENEIDNVLNKLKFQSTDPVK